MTNRVLATVFLLISALPLISAQMIGQQPDPPEVPKIDGTETLRWASDRAVKIEKTVNSAMLTHDHANLMMRLLDIYVEFDALSLVGFYCPETQRAAETGREAADLMNYRMEKDLNNLMLRALAAKEQAIKLRMAAQQCLVEMHSSEAEAVLDFAPNKVIIEEAGWAVLDIEDGMASKDFHILSQKVEHAIRLVEEIEHLAVTLDNCSEVEEWAKNAKAACLNAMGAPNWVAINRATDEAKSYLNKIKTAECSRAAAEE